MRNVRPHVFLCGCLGGALSAGACPIVAQAQAALPQGRAMQSGPGQRPDQPTLADVLDKVAWDTETRGPLLIVSADQTVAPIRRPPGTRGPLGPIPPLETDARGEYRMSQIEDRFERLIIGVHSLSVLAPTKMTVLNSTHLPKPDPYAGMAPEAKARLLFSTFTPQEWQTMSSNDGIGVADLKRDQRDLFLAMLPDPFTVYREISYGNGFYGFGADSAPNTLSEDTRNSVRITMNKAIRVSLLEQNGRNVTYVGYGQSLPTAAGTFLTLNPARGLGAQNAVFGTIIREEIPNRSKPSELAYDWSALDVTIPLGQSKTVGDLVKLIGAATHSELYCDPRYADRIVTVRGVSAQAGDVLHALAWAVTGTWRRLGASFVLTDDIDGLGVRHARIANWMQENELLAARRDAKIDKLIASAHASDFLSWSNSDPLKPNDALAAKVDANENDPNAYGRPDPLVALSELPSAAQDQARKLADSWEHPAPGFSDGTTHSPLRLDQVRVSERIQTAFVIPGVGTVDASRTLNTGILQQFLSRRNPFSQPENADAPPNPAVAIISLDPKSALRAVVVAPQTAADVQSAALAAKRAGFNEIWVDVPRNRRDLIKAAVTAGTASGLGVRPVVRLRRASSGEKTDELDRNILGETLSEHVSWWTQQLEKIGISGSPESTADQIVSGMNPRWANFGESWTDTPAVHRLLQDGDFIRCDTPETQAEIVANVADAASVPGIAGLVLADIDVPGYRKAEPGQSVFRTRARPLSPDPMIEMGYTDPNRLAFLKQNGADPVDLSPLDRGDQLSAGTDIASQLSMELPFFRDNGSGTGSPNAGFIIRRAEATEPVGTKVTYAKWREFRQGVNAAALQRVLDSVKAKAPLLAITFRREVEFFGSTGVYFGSAEPGTSPVVQDGNDPTVQPIVVPGRRQRPSQQVPLIDMARAALKAVYFAVAPGVNAPDLATQRASLIESLPDTMRSASSWDGVVLDLDESTVNDAIEILSAFQPEPDGAAGQKPLDRK